MQHRRRSENGRPVEHARPDLARGRAGPVIVHLRWPGVDPFFHEIQPGPAIGFPVDIGVDAVPASMASYQLTERVLRQAADPAGTTAKLGKRDQDVKLGSPDIHSQRGRVLKRHPALGCQPDKRFAKPDDQRPVNA